MLQNIFTYSPSNKCSSILRLIHKQLTSIKTFTVKHKHGQTEGHNLVTWIWWVFHVWSATKDYCCTTVYQKLPSTFHHLL